jgi:hypothetical protein
MLRSLTIAVLKELATNGLIDTEWVSIEERKPNSFELRVKGNCDHTLMDPFLQKYLKLEVNKEKGLLVIY